ncbi:MAG TPA: hypothetical protein VHE30_09565 [Polyangiaceae bacterium]|nr:hypothetical protein [Polyangiaceae bacterium]
MAELDSWTEMTPIEELAPYESSSVPRPVEKQQLPFGSFAGADGFFCGALTAGPLRCWGKRTDFVKGAFTQVAATRAVACGVQADGTVTCVPSEEATRFGGLTSGLGDFKVRRLAGGTNHFCALRKDGSALATEVRCVGPDAQCAPPEPPANLRARFLAVGDCLACAADERSMLTCWGKADGLNLPPPGTLAVDDLALGDGFVCALLPDGSPRCWGDAPPLSPAKYKSISAAGRTLCARGGAGALTCVGDMTAGWKEPVTRFAVGRHRVCAQLGPRDIRCAGAADDGQLEPPLDTSGVPPPVAPEDAARRERLFGEFLAGFRPATLPLHLDRTGALEVGDRIAPRYADFVRDEDESESEAWRYGARVPTPDGYVAVTIYRPSEHWLELRTYSKQGSFIAARRLASYTSDTVSRSDLADGTAREGSTARALESVVTENLEVQSIETTGAQTIHYVKALESGKQPESKRECAIDHTVWSDTLDAQGKLQRSSAKVEPVYHATDSTGCDARFPLSDGAQPSVDPTATSGDPCAASQTILVDEGGRDSTRIVETKLNGERVRTVVDQKGNARPAVDLPGRRAFGSQGFYDLRTGEARALAEAKDLVAPAFVGSGTLVVSELVAPPRADPSTVRTRVVDYAAGQAVTTFPGYSPSVSPDGSVLFLRAAAPHDGGLAAYVDVMRWDGRSTALVKRIALSDQGGPYSIGDVVALSRDRYVYRVYDEHEYRYYDQNDQPFFKGLGPAKDDILGGGHKEQYDLTISTDRRRAAFTERNWNELTYLVVLDLATRKRTATRFYGSFPAIYGDYVAFVSDPSFVRGGNVAFRQIKTYAVYAYHVPTGTLCEVGRYEEQVQPH